MRKLSIMLFVLAVTAAACGGGSDTKTNASGTNTTGTLKANASASASVSANDYCGLQGKYAGLRNFTPTADRNTIKAQLEAVKAARDEAVAKAPAEIKADVRVLADAYDPFIAVMANANYDISKINFTDPALTKIATPEVQTAAQHLAAWAQTHCK
jgi:hypothetical protein